MNKSNAARLSATGARKLTSRARSSTLDLPKSKGPIPVSIEVNPATELLFLLTCLASILAGSFALAHQPPLLFRLIAKPPTKSKCDTCNCEQVAALVFFLNCLGFTFTVNTFPWRRRRGCQQWRRRRVSWWSVRTHCPALRSAKSLINSS
jgi:hypothetical protein